MAADKTVVSSGQLLLSGNGSYVILQRIAVKKIGRVRKEKMSRGANLVYSYV